MVGCPTVNGYAKLTLLLEKVWGPDMLEMGSIPSFDRIASESERLYREKFRKEYEHLPEGEFLAIDPLTELAWHGRHPEEAVNAAMNDEPEGTFHLVRIGHPAAFYVGYSGNGKEELDRSF